MNPQTIQIKVLVENTSNRLGLLGEHGLSYFIQTKDRSLLFDTGQGLALANNAAILGADWQKVDAVVLSHGHYDHSGGLRFFSRQKNLPKIYAHPAAFEKKYAKSPQNQFRFIGISDEAISLFKDQAVWTERPTELVDGIWVTGPVPRQNEWEQYSGPFYLDDRGLQADDLLDDQSIYFTTQQGVVVLLGCAHSGVVNTLRYIQKLTGKTEIGFVAGGMHLLQSSPDRIQWTIQEFQRMNVKVIAPCHCTGTAARHALRNAYQDRYVDCSTGTEFLYELV